MRRSSGSALLAGLVLAAAAARAQELVDEVHPRAPEQPLPIVLGPWFCTECAEKGWIEPRDEPFSMLDLGLERIAEELELRRGWLAIESPNFRIFSNLDGSKVRHRDTPFAAADLRRLQELVPDFKPGGSGSYVDAHLRAHLYQVRLERILSHFRALTGNEEPCLGMGGRFQVFLLEDEEHYVAFTENLLGRPCKPQNFVERKHVHHPDSNYYVMGTYAEIQRGGDAQMNNTVLHHAAHMITVGHRNFLTTGWGWLSAGMAHFYERRESDHYNYFCRQSPEPPAKWVRGHWRKRLRHMVSRDHDPNLGSFCDRAHAMELGGDEHAVAWSYVEWLMSTDPIRLARLLDLMNDYEKKPDTNAAVQEVFGVSPHVLHDRWRDYVTREYR